MITKKPTRSGEVRYEVRLRGPDGKERSRTFRTKKEAERHERNHHAAIDSGTWIDPRAGRVTLEAWATEWQRTVVHLRPKTRRSYESNLRNHILPVLGEYELAKLTPSQLRAWMSDLTVKKGRGGKALAPATVAQAYRTLNRVLSAAVDDELIGRNPLGGVKPPQVQTTPMRFLTHEELALLAEKTDERYRALVLVAGYTGLRAGELMALRRHHVDLLRRTISITEQVQHIGGRFVVSAPKSAAGRRSVSMPRLVAEALDAHLRALEDQSVDALVFPAPEGGYLVAQNFRKRVWLPAVETAGLAPLRLHDLRHTCASLAIAAGADVKVLQRMLGHASAALTLDRYGHLMPGQAESLAERLDEMARAAGTAQLGSVESIDRTSSAAR
ncbi:MAG TPA: tyrosine-type recombinase/integrase [Acidimicrobiales bacterium]|nr:tyrosine-type recombinase/integrase [Acidimicrobiales bacterium]